MKPSPKIVFALWLMCGLAACELSPSITRLDAGQSSGDDFTDTGTDLDNDDSNEPGVNEPDPVDPVDPAPEEGATVEARVEADLSVLPGLRVPLDASKSLEAESFEWSQSSGSSVAIDRANEARASIIVPKSASIGSEFVFKVKVTNSSSQDEATIRVKVTKPAFSTFFTSSGKTEGLSFSSAGMWVVNYTGRPDSDPGFVQLLNSNAEVLEQYEIEGLPDGANFRTDGQLVVANGLLPGLQLLDPANGKVTNLATRTNDNQTLDGANYPLVDVMNNVFVSNNNTSAGKIFRYDAAKKQTRVFSSNVGSGPNAMSFGPEMNKIYVGTRDGVKRIEIRPDGTAGAVELYFKPDTACNIDGLTFDEAGSLWIGCTDSEQSIYVVDYHAAGPGVRLQKFTNSNSANNRFVNLRFGNSAFGQTTLYWTNVSKGTVGRMEVGLREFRKVLNAD